MLLLAGCAGAPERVPVPDRDAAWRARQGLLAHIESWDVRGRLALRSADDGFQASLQWVREAQRHRIELAGPLGGGRVRLTQDRSGAELRDANELIYRDSSVQQLLRRRTGWEVPIDGLNYWLLGLPAPEAPARTELDDWGRLSVLEQLGWEIRFLEYIPVGVYELPSRIFIKRKADTSAERTLEVRLVIEQWILATPAGKN